jgi:UDP-N-acetylglucosamine 2-epimerase
MDEDARTALLREGFPDDRIAITGQPAFDVIDTFADGWSDARRLELRRELAIADGARLVLFASQPLAEMSTLGCVDAVSIDEQAVLRNVADVLNRIAAEGHEIVLGVRPHPRERLDASELPQRQHLTTVLWNGPHAWAAVMAADLVVGMTSVLLVEASLLGAVVVSVQPGGRTTDPLPASKSRHIAAVYDVDELFDTLKRCLLDETSRAALQAPQRRCLPGDATVRVVDLIEKTLAQRASTL